MEQITNTKFKQIYTKFKNFYKKYRLLVTCILTSVPIIALGIIAMIFLYKPEMK
jgi:hypothetical protein